MSRGRAPRWALLAACALLAPLARGAPADESRVLRDLVYSGASTLDLYLPAPGGPTPPLVAFVASRFWMPAADAHALEARLARPLQAYGAAVAVVRHRPAPEHRHPAAVEDVAAALAFLRGRAGEFGYDPERLFVAGHSSGAQLAALVALDPSWLAAVGFAPGALAGAIAISGIYDLDPGEAVSAEELAFYEQAFGGARARRDASPLRRVRADAPPFLVLAAQSDIPGYADAAEAFAAALRAAGHPDAESYVMLGRDHRSILDLTDPNVGPALYVLDFIGVAPLPPVLAQLDAATRYWRHPERSTEPLWKTGARVREYPVDARFLDWARKLFVGLEHKRREWAPARFHAVGLEELLDALPESQVGRGEWLQLTNAQNEVTTLRLDEIRPLRPVIVVGVDDVTNLFSVVDVHRARREYSWREDLPRPPYLARPMGGFLYFLEAPDAIPLPRMMGHFSLEASSFRRYESDPLAAIRDLDPEIVAVFTRENACLACHTFRGTGARSGHLRASDGAPQGGFALALESYPPEVWRRFVFEPEEAAESIGASMNPVKGSAAQKLYELVEQERARTRAQPP